MSAEYEVGYKKPPQHTRFQPGQSGNPKGRPKGAISLPEQVRHALGKKVKVTGNGRQGRISVLEAILQRLTELAISKGDMRAIERMLVLAATYGPQPQAEEGESLKPDDQAIIDQFLARAQAENGAEGGSNNG